jgi:PTS system N-acetylgalactosamine-specific IID component
MSCSGLTLVPIVAGITANMALVGLILFLLIFNAFQFGIHYFLMYWSYDVGIKAIDILTAKEDNLIIVQSILDSILLGLLPLTLTILLFF